MRNYRLQITRLQITCQEVQTKKNKKTLLYVPLFYVGQNREATKLQKHEGEFFKVILIF
jgi:hypothetical protein